MPIREQCSRCYHVRHDVHPVKSWLLAVCSVATWTKRWDAGEWFAFVSMVDICQPRVQPTQEDLSKRAQHC